MKRVIRWVRFWGIWAYPPMAMLTYWVVRQATDMIHINSMAQMVLIIVFPLLLPMEIAATNNRRRKRGLEPMTLAEVCGFSNVSNVTKQKNVATYPKIPEGYLQRRPEQLVLGLNNKKYVCVPIDLHNLLSNILIVGPPGAGKSVLIENILLANNFIKRHFNYAMVDIKGELVCKTSYLGDSNIHIFNPTDRLAVGWDVYFALHVTDNPTIDLQIEAFSDIAKALITGNEHDAYFIDNARSILVGVMAWNYDKGDGQFITSVQALLLNDIGSLIDKIVKEYEVAGELHSIAMLYLAKFKGKSGNESLQDIATTVTTPLSIFLKPSLVWALRDNPYMTSPAVLDDGHTCIDINIPEYLVDSYANLLRLMTTQIADHCAKRPESQFATALIFDELPRYAPPIKTLKNILSLGRARGIICINVVQSISQLQAPDCYAEADCNSIWALSELKIILNCSDSQTAQWIQQSAGEYTDEAHSYKKKGITNHVADMQYSQSDKHVIDLDELASLRTKNELICFVFGRYYRFSKLFYFKDPILSPIAEEVKRYNTSIIKS